MNKLIVVVGDSGSGKSHLARLSANRHKDIKIIKKYSDREIRPSEMGGVPEIQPGCSTEQVKNLEYSYVGAEEKNYGFSKKEIDKVLEDGYNPILIAPNKNILTRLCKDYKDKICPIYIQRAMSDEDFVKELGSERSKEQIEARISTRWKMDDFWRERKNLFGYRYIINGLFMNDELLENWFELILRENDVNIETFNTKAKGSGIIGFFRNIWKDRPTFQDITRNSPPVIEEDERDDL